MSAPIELKTPVPLMSEHAALRAAIRRARKFPGSTGKSARLVARLIEAHFAKEEEFALPLLGLLPKLAQGIIEPRMQDAIKLATRLNSELPDFLAEQRAIVGALEELMAVAEKEGHEELVGFAEEMMLHEEIEQQVSYPTAILIGKYLQLQFKT